MEIKLTQKDFRFNRKEFTIIENGLAVKNKGLFSSSEYLISFEDMGTNISKSNNGINGFLKTGIMLVLLAILLFILKMNVEDGASLFYIGLAFISLIIFALTFKKKIYLTRAGHVNAIEFSKNQPSEHEVDTFIKTLIEKRNGSLNKKFGQINSYISYEQNYNNFNWLLVNDSISIVEFEAKVQELSLIFNLNTQGKFSYDLNPN